MYVCEKRKGELIENKKVKGKICLKIHKTAGRATINH